MGDMWEACILFILLKRSRIQHCEEAFGGYCSWAVVFLNSLYLPQSKAPHRMQPHKSPPLEFHNQQKLTPITRDKKSGTLIRNHLKRHCHKALLSPIYSLKGSFILPKRHLFSPECLSIPPFLLLSWYISPKL